MPKGRAIIPCTGTVVKSCPNGKKRLSKSNELDAQHVSPHQIPKKQKQQFLRVYCAKKLNDHLTEQKTPFQSVQFMLNTKTDSVLIKKVVF